MTLIDVEQHTTRIAALLGLGSGVGVLGLYLVGGILLANWDVVGFSENLTIEIVGWLLFASALAISIFAVPVFAIFRFDVVSPIIVLVVVIAGWLVQGFATGVLAIETAFGLAFYAMSLSPLYLALYLALGWVEYQIRG